MPKPEEYKEAQSNEEFARQEEEFFIKVLAKKKAYEDEHINSRRERQRAVVEQLLQKKHVEEYLTFDPQKFAIELQQRQLQHQEYQPTKQPQEEQQQQQQLLLTDKTATPSARKKGRKK